MMEHGAVDNRVGSVGDPDVKDKIHSPRAKWRRMFWLAHFWFLPFLTQALAAWNARSTVEANHSETLRIESDFPYAEPYFESVGDQSMVPGGVVTALVHDSRGFLWIGTQLGLICYDGFRFRKFLNDPEDSGSIGGNYISCLWAAEDGSLWVGLANNGLSVFHPDKDQFETYRQVPGQKESLSDNSVYAILGDSEQGVWVAGNQGLDLFDPVSKSFRHLQSKSQDPTSLLDNKVRALHLDRKKRLWVGSLKGLQLRKSDGSGFEKVYFSDQGSNSSLTPELWTIFEAVDGTMWLGTRGNGVFRLDPEHRILLPIHSKAELHKSLSQGWIYSIAQPVQEEIWLATIGKGILVLSAVDGSYLRTIQHNPTLPGSLAGNDIGPLLSNASGLLWVGCWGAGLQRHNPRNRAFRMLRHSPLQSRGLSLANLTSLMETKEGRLFVGTAGNGIDILDRRLGLTGAFRPRNERGGSLPDGQIIALTQTPDGSVWVGTRYSGALQLRPGGSEWRKYSLEQGLPHPQVNSFLLDQGGSLWAATSGGVARLNADGSGFETFLAAEGGPMQARVFALVEDRQKRLWVASQRDLWVKELGGHAFHSIRHEPERSSSLNSGELSSLLVDRTGQLWVGTLQELDRLVQWDGRTAEFEHIGKKLGHGKPLLCVNLLEDLRGRIWTDTFVFDPAEQRIFEFSKADGFDIDGAWRGSAAATKDGLLMFGGPLGLAIIDPERFRPYHYQPPLVATGLKIDGIAQPLGLLSPRLVITPRQRNLVIEFSSLDFSAPQQTHYAYRMYGLEEKWIEADSENRSAAYGNLWPGEYKLQVRGSNRSGEWSSQLLEIPISVQPAFWQTGWFATLLCLTLGGGLYAGHRKHTQLLRARAQALQELVEARTTDILNLGKIGQELTATLDLEQALLRVYQQVSARLDAHVFGIGLFDEEEQEIHFSFLIEEGRRMSYESREEEKREWQALRKPANFCLRNRQELLCSTREEMQGRIEAQLPEIACGVMETQVFIPLIAQQKAVGCLTVQSARCYAYDGDQLKFLRVLSSYAAIALENANIHSELLSSHKRLQESKQQLILQEKMAGIGALTAGIAHELNNPLNFINNLSELSQELAQDFCKEVQVQRGQMLEDKVIETFHEIAGELEANSAIILKHGRRANHIVKAMRDMVQKSGGSKSQSELNSFVKEYVNISFKYEKTNDKNLDIELEFDLDLNAGQILMRTQDMGRVFHNLIQNAVYAVREKGKKSAIQDHYKGRILIRTKKLEKHVQLEFWDNGTGVEPDQLSQVFAPFFTTKPTGQGNIGLGLSTVYDIIVKEHGGKIWLESEVGRWTNVKFQLPNS